MQIIRRRVKQKSSGLRNTSFLKVERHFRSVYSSFSDEQVSGKNVMKYTPQRKRLWNESYGKFTREVEIANLDKLKISSTVKKRTRIERSMTPINVTNCSAMNSSEGSHSQQGRKTITVKLLDT